MRFLLWPAGCSHRHLDQLANEGIAFPSFFPASWTWTSTVSIMTGYSPIVHQCLRPEAEIPAAFAC
jgi:hypothetical protein